MIHGLHVWLAMFRVWIAKCGLESSSGPHWLAAHAEPTVVFHVDVLLLALIERCCTRDGAELGISESVLFSISIRYEHRVLVDQRNKRTSGPNVQTQACTHWQTNISRAWRALLEGLSGLIFIYVYTHECTYVYVYVQICYFTMAIFNFTVCYAAGTNGIETTLNKCNKQRNQVELAAFSHSH